MGWDEAFLEVHTDDPESFAREVSEAVETNTRLASSVGIGDNKLRAKLATGFAKPAGIFRLTVDNWWPVMGDLPTDALWGIGRKTARKLAELGAHSVADLSRTDAEVLAKRLGPTMGPWYRRIARGEDRTPVIGTPYVPRSRSRETTFQVNLTDWDDVRREIVTLAHRVADDVAAEGRPVVRVAVKVRLAPFQTYTRSVGVAEPTLDPAAIEAGALAALARFEPGRAVRLLGVRADFASPSDQPDDPTS